MRKKKVILQSREESLTHTLELVSEHEDNLVYKLKTLYNFRICANPTTNVIEWIDLSSGPMISLGYEITVNKKKYELYNITLGEHETYLKFKLA